MRTKENKAMRERMLTDYLSRRIRLGEVFIRYERGEDGKPSACFVALQEGGKLMCGWSRCSLRDQFARKLCLRIAISRALSQMAMPEGSETMSFPYGGDFVTKAEKYFEERNAAVAESEQASQS